METNQETSVLPNTAILIKWDYRQLPIRNVNIGSHW